MRLYGPQDPDGASGLPISFTPWLRPVMVTAFLLPTNAHLHAYEIAKKSTTISKCFKVRVEQ